MTKIGKKKTEEDMRMHRETLLFLKEHLRTGYPKEARRRLKLKSIEYSEASIRSIKSGSHVDWQVLKVLAEIAKEEKESKEAVLKIITNNN